LLRAGLRRKEGLFYFFFPAVETAGYCHPSPSGDSLLSSDILTFSSSPCLRASAPPW
jgi:hypothetical protein